MRRADGRVVKGLPWSRRAPVQVLRLLLTNSCGQATNALVSLFTKQCELVPAS